MKTYNVNYFYTIQIKATDEDNAIDLANDDFIENPPRLKDMAIETESK